MVYIYCSNIAHVKTAPLDRRLDRQEWNSIAFPNHSQVPKVLRSTEYSLYLRYSLLCTLYPPSYKSLYCPFSPFGSFLLSPLSSHFPLPSTTTTTHISITSTSTSTLHISIHHSSWPLLVQPRCVPCASFPASTRLSLPAVACTSPESSPLNPPIPPTRPLSTLLAPCLT